MAKVMKMPRYVIARKSVKGYMRNPIITTVNSITNMGKEQILVVDEHDAEFIKGKKVAIIDDVISTGSSIEAIEKLVKESGGEVIARAAVLAEGDAADRTDIIYLEKIPLFFHNNNIAGMVAMMAIVLIFMMMYRNPAVALMPDITPKPLRAKANGIINIMGYFGGAFATVLGIFLPLIVVNCIVLGRAEMFANKNNVLDSLFDGLGMGIGYTLVLTAISVVRELLGSGSLLGYQIIPEEYTIRIISQTPGGFFMFGLAMAMLVLGMSKKGKKFVPEMGCGDGGCAGCGNADSCTEKDKEAKN